MNSNKEHWILCPGLRLQNAGTAAAGYCVCWILQFGLEEFWIHLNVHDDCADTDIQNSIVTGYAHIFVHCFSTLSPFCYFKTYFHALLS